MSSNGVHFLCYSPLDKFNKRDDSKYSCTTIGIDNNIIIYCTYDYKVKLCF